MRAGHIAYPRAMLKSIVVLLVVLSFVACGGDEPPTTSAAEAPESVTGVIVDIESAAINDVESFTLKDGDAVYEILIDTEVDYGFPLGHLQEHVQTAAPVEVDLEERDDKLYALSIVDV